MRKFNDKSLDTLYQLRLMCPPTRWIEHKQLYCRRTGSGVYFPFWVGYDHPNTPCPYVHGSPAHAVWAAGVDYQRAGGRDYVGPGYGNNIR